MYVTVKVIFFEIYIVDVRRKPVHLWCVVMCHDGKELNFKLTKTPMVEGTKLNLVLIHQMNHDKKNNGHGSSEAI